MRHSRGIGKRDKYLDGVNIVSDHDELSLLALNERRDVVQAVLHEVGRGNGGGLLTLLESGDLGSPLLKTVSLLGLGLGPVLVHEGKEVLGCAGIENRNA